MSKYTELLDNIVGRCNEDGEFEKRCTKLEEHIEDIIVEHIQNNEVFLRRCILQVFNITTNSI